MLLPLLPTLATHHPHRIDMPQILGWLPSIPGMPTHDILPPQQLIQDILPPQQLIQDILLPQRLIQDISLILDKQPTPDWLRWILVISLLLILVINLLLIHDIRPHPILVISLLLIRDIPRRPTHAISPLLTPVLHKALANQILDTLTRAIRARAIHCVNPPAVSPPKSMNAQSCWPWPTSACGPAKKQEKGHLPIKSSLSLSNDSENDKPLRRLPQRMALQIHPQHRFLLKMKSND